jgi:formate C-acetyltransferase
MEKGKDVKNGGADKNLTGVALLGLGTMTDSLMAIKKAVFEDQKFSLNDYKKMLKKDFQGYESERQYILNKIPKYGNDDDAVDMIAKDITDFCSSELKNYTTFRNGQYALGAHSENGQLVFGFVTGATPDGRKQLEPLSVGAINGRGREKKGYTAALKSVSKLDPSKVISGVSVNMKFHPDLVNTDDKRQRFQDMIETYFYDFGGQNLQATVISNDTLRNAQQCPDDYQDLLVRISGYSARFVELTHYTQDEIISRTEHH